MINRHPGSRPSEAQSRDPVFAWRLEIVEWTPDHVRGRGADEMPVRLPGVARSHKVSF